MNHKTNKKKPPTGQAGSGEGEKQRGSDIFYPDYITIPDYCQIDYAKLADIYSLKSDYWHAMAEAARVLAILQVTEGHNED